MIVALFAVDQCGGMGFEGSLPWPRNREDMQWFKSTTENQIVVMGRNTWNSKDMPIPLPNRVNVLVTNTFIDNEDIIQVRGDIPESLLEIQRTYPDKIIFVIGGPGIILQSKPVLERLYITKIPGEYLNDTRIELSELLDSFTLLKTNPLNTCEIEIYEAISRST